MDEFRRSEMAFACEVNPRLDAEAIREGLRSNGRVRVRNFFMPDVAAALYRYLLDRVTWRTFLVANEQLMGTALGEPVGTDLNVEKEILDCAYEGARTSFAYAYDADQSFPEDCAGVQFEQSVADSVPLRHFWSSTTFVETARQFTGLTDLGRSAIQATRFRAGHFVGFNSGTWSADKTGKRRASFSFNLTPEWKPEWGGALEFRTKDSDIIESFMPSFNTLDIIAFPQGHWISPVAPFAGGPRLAISGRLFAS